MAICLEQTKFPTNSLCFPSHCHSFFGYAFIISNKRNKKEKEKERKRNVSRILVNRWPSLTRFYWTWHNPYYEVSSTFPDPSPKSNGRATSIIFDITYHGSRQQMFHRKSNRYLHNTFLPVKTLDRPPVIK